MCVSPCIYTFSYPLKSRLSSLMSHLKFTFLITNRNENTSCLVSLISNNPPDILTGLLVLYIFCFPIQLACMVAFIRNNILFC